MPRRPSSVSLLRLSFPKNAHPRSAFTCGGSLTLFRCTTFLASALGFHGYQWRLQTHHSTVTNGLAVPFGTRFPPTTHWSFWEGSCLASNATLPCILPPPGDVFTPQASTPSLGYSRGGHHPRQAVLDSDAWFIHTLTACPTAWTRYLAQRSL